MKKKKLTLITIISLPVIFTVITVIAVRPTFLKNRLSDELNEIIENGVRLDLLLENTEIVEYRKAQSSIYTKLKLPIDEYDYLKQRLLLIGGTASDKDYSDEVHNEESRYCYNSDCFLSLLSVINNLMHRREVSTLNLDAYEELLITSRLLSVYSGFMSGTTGEAYYVLVKENSGNCYLYYIKTESA